MKAYLVLFALATPTVVGAEAKYQFAFRKADEDAGEVRAEKDRTVFVLTNRSGIGGVVITLKEGEWPRDIVLRMRYDKERGFKMLEMFTLTTNRLEVSGSQRQSDEMELSFIGPDGKRGGLAGKLKVSVKENKGALEVTLPAYLLTGAREVRLDWIDAFRR